MLSFISFFACFFSFRSTIALLTLSIIPGIISTSLLAAPESPFVEIYLTFPPHTTRNPAGLTFAPPPHPPPNSFSLTADPALGAKSLPPAPNPKEYTEFCIKTGRVIKANDKNAKVITGSHYDDSMTFFNEEFALGILEVADAVSYHTYNYDESYSVQRIRALKSLSEHYGKSVEIIQGETGSQSKNGGNGALHWIRTNEDMHTKYILRHIVADVMTGVKFTSVFSLVDMAENLDAKADGPITSCGYFGLLGAEFDKSTGRLVGDYYEKSSYYAFQNLCSLFDEKVVPQHIPVIFTPIYDNRINGFNCRTRDINYGGVTKSNGAKAFVYWNSTDMVSCQKYEGTVTFELSGVSGDVKLVDPWDGSVY